jgi:hypothetical protein
MQAGTNMGWPAVGIWSGAFGMGKVAWSNICWFWSSGPRSGDINVGFKVRVFALTMYRATGGVTDVTRGKGWRSWILRSVPARHSGCGHTAEAHFPGSLLFHGRACRRRIPLSCVCTSVHPRFSTGGRGGTAGRLKVHLSTATSGRKDGNSLDMYLENACYQRSTSTGLTRCDLARFSQTSLRGFFDHQNLSVA